MKRFTLLVLLAALIGCSKPKDEETVPVKHSCTYELKGFSSYYSVSFIDSTGSLKDTITSGQWTYSFSRTGDVKLWIDAIAKSKNTDTIQIKLFVDGIMVQQYLATHGEHAISGYPSLIL